MTSTQPLKFYDISSPLSPRSYAPNPSKARMALSFKRVPFVTVWTDILDIPIVRKQLNCPATRKLDDGSDFCTLPMLEDPNSGKVIGDSFDIANYVEDNFPPPSQDDDENVGSLFPVKTMGTGLDYESPAKDTVFFAPITTNQGSKNGAYARFNLHVDATFSANIAPFAHFMPFNPETADAVKVMMAKRAHLNSWDDLCMPEEARAPLVEAFKASLESLAKFFQVHDEGPFLEGKGANYADLIVGGWVNMLFAVMREEEWAEFRGWHGGVFGRLHDALQESYYRTD
ncbi:hypothetical protein DM02DRAFT_591015 [Periconia macrospinosa]|uniref:GST N-terminal domain-containing protein n=1 Tax=Periconia macrospinosa TaxID=97972 RepID=A0A2V1DTR4_9PLEO|nr:hypothetical protein DM02DRAFT_591015 [Periconia macrospinosa]